VTTVVVEMTKESLGDHELALLRYVSENGPLTVGETAKAYGAPLGLARTTILTMMERLRTKGYLARQKENGVFQYSLRIDHDDLLTRIVGDFVQKSLGGSLSPFVSYLVDSGRLSQKEIGELRKMVENLETAEVKK
jgi:predicted transcriptional regulator